MADEFGNISLSEEPSFGDISLNEPTQAVSVPPEVAQPRATKAHYGLGDQSPGFDALFNGISNGQEDQLRQNIARQYDSYLRLKKMDTVQKMAQEGSDANIENAKALLAWDSKSDPDTIFEKTYAQKYVSTVANSDTATTMASLAQDTDRTHEVLNQAQDFTSTQESFKKIEEEAADFYKKQFFSTPTVPMLGAKGIQDFITSGLPFISAINKRNIATETASILPGDNLDEQITYLWSLPPDKAPVVFRDAIRKLQLINPLDAMNFAHEVNSFSNQDRVMTNAGAFLDATIIGGPLMRLARLIKGGLKGNAAKDINVGNTLEAIGDTEKAAEVKAVEITQARSQPTIIPTVDRGFDPLGQKLDLTGVLPSYSKPSTLAVGDNAGSLSREQSLRIVGRLEQQNKTIEDTTTGLARVSRLTQERLEQGISDTVVKMKDEFTDLHDAVLDVRTGVHGFEHLEAENTRTNVDYVLMNLGKEGKPETLTNDLGFPLGPIREREETPSLSSLTKKERKSERVTSAAIKVDGKVYEAPTHAQAYNKADEAINDKSFDTAAIESGFMTNRGRFISHEEATSLAIDNRQVFGRKKIRKSGANVYSQDFKEGQLTQPEFLTTKEANFGEVVVGKPDATLFKSSLEADRTAQRDYNLNTNQYTVVQGPGNTWYISIVRPVDETTGALRKMALELDNTNSTSVINSVAKGFVAHLRTPADQVAKFTRNNRLIATTAPSAIHAMIKELAAPIVRIQKESKGIGRGVLKKLGDKSPWDNLNDVLDYYNTFEDYSKENSRGMWPTSMAQLQKDWKKVTGKLPLEHEQLAFWTTVKLNDLDWVLRNYNLHRDLARQGIEHVAIPHPGELPGTYTNPVWGKVLGWDKESKSHKDFPWHNPEDGTIAIYKDGAYSYHDKNTIKVENPELAGWINRPSVKVTQIAAPDVNPFKGILEHNPHFVISEDIQRSPLPIKLVDYNGGGHVIYPGGYYGKQSVIEQGLKGRFYHYSDKTIFNFTTRAQAEQYVPRAEQFRVLMKEGKTDAELSNFVEKYLPNDLDFWKNKFVGKNANLSLDHPIMITERGHTTFTTNPDLKRIYKEKLGQDVISYPESSYNLTGGIDKSFLQERDGPLMSIKSRGFNPWTPEYKLEKAPILRPMYAMERGIHNAIRGLYLNDVKTSSVEQWISQYKTLLRDPIDKVLRNPYYQFYHGELADEDALNYRMVQSAKNARNNLKSFLRTSSDMQGDIDTINQELMSKVYNANLFGKRIGGEVGKDALLDWYEPKQWSLIKHPMDFFKSASSNLRFGHYNPVQAVVQTLGARHAINVDPIYGLQGSAAALLHNYYRLGQSHLPEKVSEGVLDALDRMALIGGWKKGQFRSSVEAMERMGFDHVGREVAWRDSISDPSIFDNGYQRYMDKSYVFFNWGDRNNRMVAWHMAYKRLTQENPDRAVNDRFLGEILNRADLLGANMTKESNSAIQKGVFSPFLQFRTFQMRIAEQMMGDRLTKAEKLQAFIGEAAWMGIPTAISAYGLKSFGVPIPGGIENVYDDMRKYMINNGHENVDNWIRLLHDGIMDHMITMATGTRYNVAKRYGSGTDYGITDITNGVTDAVATALGPSGSLLESIVRVTYPFVAGILTAGRGTSETYKPTQDEVIDVIKQISSVNVGYNIYMALNYHRYVAQNKQVVNDSITKTDAVMMALGLTRSDLTDTRIKQSLAHDQGKYEDSIGNKALEEYRKALQSAADGNMANFDKYLVNGNVILNVLGDVSEKKKDALWKQVLGEKPTLAERANELIYNPSRMPPSKIPARLKEHFGIDVNKGK